MRGEAPHALAWEHFCVVACGFLAAAPGAACVRADLAACAEAALARLPQRVPVVMWMRERPGLRSEEQLADAARAWMRRHGGRRRVRWVVDDAEAGAVAAAAEEARTAVKELGDDAWLVASYERMARDAGRRGRRVCLFLDGRDTVAGEVVPGSMVDYDAMAAAALAMLDSKLRANERGLPEGPPSVMIPPLWRDG